MLPLARIGRHAFCRIAMRHISASLYVRRAGCARGERGVAFEGPGRWPDVFTRIRPYSWAAATVALACFGTALVLRIIIGWLGVDAPYLAFFLAVLVTALLAGTPAAAAVTVASALVGSLIFGPAVFGLHPTGIANTLTFIVASGLVIIVARLYRNAFERLSDKENQRDLLVHELQHRGRNTYAIVESIVRNTLGPDSMKADAIAARVRAVSSANDLVNWTVSNDRAVPLGRLLDLVFGANAERISVSGPSIALSPTAIRTLSLVFHELLTNAMKYGALSSPHGMIAISWTVAGNEVRLHWIETGGPAISVPARSGFGTSVITHSLASLSGTIDFDFVSSGLQCTVGFNPNT